MKLKHLIIAIFCVGYVAYIGVVWAHHAIGADFNPDEYITIKALVKDFRFINPHPYATADEIDAEGEEREWRLLLDDRWELVEVGFSRSTLQPGDELVVIGMPSQREENTLYVRQIERPSDGFVYIEDEGEQEDSRPASLVGPNRRNGLDD